MRKKKVFGTLERPRLSVFRGIRNIHAQIIVDSESRTLVSASTVEKGLLKNGGNLAAAKKIGSLKRNAKTAITKKEKKSHDEKNTEKS